MKMASWSERKSQTSRVAGDEVTESCSGRTGAILPSCANLVRGPVTSDEHYSQLFNKAVTVLRTGRHGVTDTLVRIAKPILATHYVPATKLYQRKG